MPELTLDIIGVEALQATLRRIPERAQDLSPALKRSSLIVLKSIESNFRAGGRPRQWEPLAPSTVAGRRKGSSRPLQDTGQLSRAPTVLHLDRQHVRIGLPGEATNEGMDLRRLAAIHQFGAKIPAFDIVPKHGKALAFPVPHSTRIATSAGGQYARLDTPQGRRRMLVLAKVRFPGATIPARPFMLMQTEDRAAIIQEFEAHLARLVREATSQ